MASGNSDSFQSSSGGDEEYDSRSAESSFPTFLNDPSFPFCGGLSNYQSSSLSLHHQIQNHPSSSSLFDPSTSYNNLHSNNNPTTANPLLLNLDVSRSMGITRSDINSNNSNYGTLQPPQDGLNSISSAPPTAHQSLPADQNNVHRNPRKRTRASRRAPTTVLTTDPTNFRAMVQEFTGIPMAPFSGGSYSRRLDLFGPGSSLRSSHLDPLRPLFPIRPAAQKFQPIATSSSSSPLSTSLLNNIMLDPSNHDMSNPRTTSNASSVGGTTIDASHQIPFPRQPQDMLNVPNNSFLTFQSLLQSPLAAANNVSSFGARSQGGSLNLSSFEELSSLGGHGRQLDTNLGSVLASAGEGRQEDHQVRPRFSEGIDHGDASQRVNNGGCKLNFSGAALPEFRGEKALEDHASVGRGEGTVDSWICPSD